MWGVGCRVYIGETLSSLSLLGSSSRKLRSVITIWVQRQTPLIASYVGPSGIARRTCTCGMCVVGCGVWDVRCGVWGVGFRTDMTFNPHPSLLTPHPRSYLGSGVSKLFMLQVGRPGEGFYGLGFSVEGLAFVDSKVICCKVADLPYSKP